MPFTGRTRDRPPSLLDGTRAREAACASESSSVLRCQRCPQYEHEDEERRPDMRVYGLITALAFQKARLCVEKLYRSFADQMEEPIIQGMMDFEWENYLINEQRVHGGRLWDAHSGVVVWDGSYFVGDDKDLMRYIASDVMYSLPQNNMLHYLRMVDDYYGILSQPERVFVTMDFRVGELPIGSLMFELFPHLLPMTCLNFINLCKGQCEPNAKGATYRYKGTRVHRIVKEGWIQCGDVTKIIGGGGHSAFATKTFPDESLAVKHDRRGVLSMCNSGPNSNQSQFLVTLAPAPWMDSKYVAFGHAVEGARVLSLLESVRTLYETPIVPIVITDCNVLESAGAKFWPQRTTSESFRSPEFASSLDVLQPPPMPPAPPGISEVLKQQGPRLWHILSAREKDGRVVTEKEAVMKTARSASLAPIEVVAAEAKAVIAAAIAKQGSPPKSAALTTPKSAPGTAEAHGVKKSAQVAAEKVWTALMKAADRNLVLKHMQSVHDVRDVDSRLSESRFLQGLYSLTVPDPIIWNAFDRVRDHLDENTARTLMLLVAQRASQQCPCEELGEDDEPSLPLKDMPDALKGQLCGTWSGKGTLETAAGQWPWEGEGTLQLVSATTDEPIGLPSIAGFAYEIAEELLTTLDRQENVLQDPARWASRVGEALTLRICTAGKEAAEEKRVATQIASEIAEEVLNYSIEQVTKEKKDTVPEEKKAPRKSSEVETLLYPQQPEEYQSDDEVKEISREEAFNCGSYDATGDIVDGTLLGSVMDRVLEMEDTRAQEELEAEEPEMLTKSESATSRLIAVLIGTEFLPGKNVTLAYSALIAQELLKELASEPPGKRPDLETAAAMFSIEELPDAPPCHRAKARKLMEAAFQIVKEVQIAAADVAFKHGVRSALPKEYLGYPPGDVARLKPLTDEEKRWLQAKQPEDGEQPMTSASQITPSPKRSPRQIYRERRPSGASRGVYRPLKAMSSGRPGDDLSRHHPGFPGAHV